MSNVIVNDFRNVVLLKSFFMMSVLNVAFAVKSKGLSNAKSHPEGKFVNM